LKNTKTAPEYNHNEIVYNEDEQFNARMIFDNLIWLTTDEAAVYIRKSVNALRIDVHKGHIHARKFKRRLYFRKSELDQILDTSSLQARR